MLCNGVATIINLSRSDSDTTSTTTAFESSTSHSAFPSKPVGTTSNTKKHSLININERYLVTDRCAIVRAVRIAGVTTSITTDEDIGESLDVEVKKCRSCIEFQQSTKLYNCYQIVGRSASTMGFLNFNSECLQSAFAIEHMNLNSLYAANAEPETSSSSYFSLFMKASSSLSHVYLPTPTLKAHALCSAAGADASDTCASPQKSRLYRMFANKWCSWIMWPILILSALITVAYFTKDYAHQLMIWMERQNQWIVISCIALLFLTVSFPIAVGYFLLKLTTGYLYGFLRGLILTIAATSLGITSAHIVLRSLQRRFNLQKYIKNKNAIAILRVINGSNSFRIVIFSRMTPLPFGVQNLIFSLSTLRLIKYLAASFIGMLPSQLLAIYLGSGLRSMQEVLSNKKTILPSYVLIGVGVVFGFSLMTWIILKARIELAKMLAEQNDAVA